MAHCTCGLKGLTTLFIWAAGALNPDATEAQDAPAAFATPSSGTAIDAAPQPAAPLPTSLPVPPPALTTSVLGPPAALTRSRDEADFGLPFKAPLGDAGGLIALAVVLGVIVLLVIVVRRFVPSVRAKSNGPLSIVQRTYLSPKQSVALLRVGRRLVLVGVTPDRISLLGQIDDAEESAWVLAESEGRRDGAEFDRLLASEARTYGQGPVEPALHRGEGPQRLEGARGSLQGVLARLRSVRTESESRSDSPSR